VALSDEQIEALDELSFHPALHNRNGPLLDTVASEPAEIGRAAHYLDLVGEEERKRRAAINYRSMHHESRLVRGLRHQGPGSARTAGWLDEVAIDNASPAGFLTHCPRKVAVEHRRAGPPSPALVHRDDRPSGSLAVSYLRSRLF